MCLRICPHAQSSCLKERLGRRLRLLFEEGINQYQLDQCVLFELMTTPSLRCNISSSSSWIDLQRSPKKQRKKGGKSKATKDQDENDVANSQGTLLPGNQDLVSTPIPRRTRSSHQNQETPTTETTLNLETTIPIEIIDVDAKSTSGSDFCRKVSSLVQNHFKEISCSKTLIEFLYSIANMEFEEEFIPSQIIKHSPFTIVSLYHIHKTTRPHLFHQLSKKDTTHQD